MRWSDFEKYVRGAHLQGRRVTLTIAGVQLEEVHAGGEAAEKPVLYFKETKKGLILTPTNQRVLADLFGDDVAACVGQRITLEAVRLKVAGRETLPIRLRKPDDPPVPAA